MALTLTVGTNTYISLTDAETYMEGRYEPSGAWAAATNATKNQLLVTATQIIDRQNWLGSKSSSTQTLQFPRDGGSTTDTDYDRVERATVEQALWLLTQSGTRADLKAQGVRAVTVGGVHETWGPGNLPPLCQIARQELAEWLPLCGALV